MAGNFLACCSDCATPLKKAPQQSQICWQDNSVDWCLTHSFFIRDTEHYSIRLNFSTICILLALFSRFSFTPTHFTLFCNQSSRIYMSPEKKPELKQVLSVPIAFLQQWHTNLLQSCSQGMTKASAELLSTLYFQIPVCTWVTQCLVRLWSHAILINHLSLSQKK